MNTNPYQLSLGCNEKSKGSSKYLQHQLQCLCLIMCALKCFMCAKPIRKACSIILRPKIGAMPLLQVFQPFMNESTPCFDWPSAMCNNVFIGLSMLGSVCVEDVQVGFVSILAAVALVLLFGQIHGF